MSLVTWGATARISMSLTTSVTRGGTTRMRFAGFSSGGVVAGSIAAGTQAGIGNCPSIYQF